jgi:carbamoyltransferase
LGANHVDLIEPTIEKFKDTVVSRQATDDEVVDLLADQKIVAVFGGGSESGRRALGNRSILADPRSEDMKDIINHKVKHRQWFRPFAPSILREETSNWFTEDKDSPYMSFVLMFKEEQKSKVPAVVHFNGSARLQTVTENDNKWYYNFIKKWHVKSGVPILLNTSFNDREPICETPEHAINCFLGTEIDYLYFHEKGILLERRKD